MPIRRMTAPDILRVVRIATASPEAAPWTAATYALLLDDPQQGEVWVEEEEGMVSGFASFRLLGAEAELLNLAVHPASRRQGCGSRLIERICAEAARLGVERIFLEVRASNEAGLCLYRRFGFQKIGLRPGYYPNPPPAPPEDAIVLAKTIDPASPASSKVIIEL